MNIADSQVLYHVLPVIPSDIDFICDTDVRPKLRRKCGREIWQYQVKLIDCIAFNLKLISYVAKHIDTYAGCPPEVFSSCEQLLVNICAYELSLHGYIFKKSFLKTHILSRSTARVFKPLYALCLEKTPESILFQEPHKHHLDSFANGRPYWFFIMPCILNYIESLMMDPVFSKSLLKPFMSCQAAMRHVDGSTMQIGMMAEYQLRFGSKENRELSFK